MVEVAMPSKNHRHHHPSHSPDSAVTAEATEQDQIQRLAYHYWQERGCPLGDPETDWLRAEEEVHRQQRLATRL